MPSPCLLVSIKASFRWFMKASLWALSLSGNRPDNCMFSFLRYVGSMLAVTHHVQSWPKAQRRKLCAKDRSAAITRRDGRLDEKLAERGVPHTPLSVGCCLLTRLMSFSAGRKSGPLLKWDSFPVHSVHVMCMTDARRLCLSCRHIKYYFDGPFPQAPASITLG